MLILPPPLWSINCFPEAVTALLLVVIFVMTQWVSDFTTKGPEKSGWLKANYPHLPTLSKTDLQVAESRYRNSVSCFGQVEKAS